MTEEQFYKYINDNLGKINGGNVYVKPTYLPMPQPQPNPNPFTGRLSHEWWKCIRLEIGIVTPFGETLSMGKGDTFDLCLADLKKNHPNLP